MSKAAGRQTCHSAENESSTERSGAGTERLGVSTERSGLSTERSGTDDIRRQLIESVFEESLDLPSDRRAAWLAARCGADEELRAEVESLLAAFNRSEPLLDGGAGRFSGLANTLCAELGTRHSIGPYQVVREIGRGGMGVVYLADRNDGQYRHRVAVKLLLASPEAHEVRHRFLAERQILATLSHPNISQLLDGGVFENRVPYLVIEYVDGVPITAYCQRESLGIDARLRLFRDVCAAVHHAHSHLILHLDVKPSNILVTRTGQVKLLDFGIAKLLGPRPSDRRKPLTLTGSRPMTPAYASPEQMRGDPVSTASDVYGLGLVLYELLTDLRAQDVETKAPHEAMLQIVEREPPRPSLCPSPIARGLRGDLDAIVMMALRKEPEQRYGSANLLSADIGRYLEGLPVSAHRGSTTYRCGKLLRRHWVATAAVAFSALAFGSAGTAFWQARVAERERARAANALAGSEALAAFLIQTFEPGATGSSLRDTLTVDALLERAAIRAEGLRASPLLQARIFEALGRAHRSRGNQQQAFDFTRRAVALRAGADKPHASTMRTNDVRPSENPPQ